MTNRLNNASVFIRVLHKEDDGKAHESLFYAETEPLKPLVVNLTESKSDGSHLIINSRTSMRTQRRQMPRLGDGMHTTIEMWLSRKRAELEEAAAELTRQGLGLESITEDGFLVGR